MKIKIIITTTDSDKIANNIAECLVKDNLSPCVQIVSNIKSFYSWEGKLDESCEILLLIKTIPENLEDCKKFGTLPFAGLARCSFISTEILNSFVEEKIFTENDKLKFLASIKTVTTELNEDLNRDKKKFLNKYGHLRPGTYEITSLNYRKNFKNYFSNYSKSKKIIPLKIVDNHE